MSGAASPGLFSIRWAPRDRAKAVGPLAGVGLIVAAALSVFGLPPVSIHPPLHYVGVMDPFCGMTRGVAATARGDFAAAWRFNPASPLVVACLVAAVGRTVFGATTGRWLELRIERPRVFFTAALVFFVGLEINQQMHADLLR